MDIDLDSSRPNVVIFVLDCLRADRLSCYSYHKHTSPQIDRFASESTIFSHAFATSPWTVPSHGSLFTGLTPSELGINRDYPRLDDQFLTLAQFLKQRGYRTIMLSQNPLVGPDTNLHMGFDHYVPLFGDTAKIIGPFQRFSKLLRFGRRKTEDLLNQLGDSFGNEHVAASPRPLFLFLNLLNTHPPFFPPLRFHGEFYHPILNPYTLIYHLFFKTLRLLLPSKVYHRSRISRKEYHLISHLYDLEIQFMDYQIGRLLNWLRQASLWENTLIVVTSDHGENLGERGYTGHGVSLYDGEIRVPLIIKQPGFFEKNKRYQKVVSLSDVFYTIVDIVGDPKKVVDDRLVKERSLLGRALELNEGGYVFSEVDEAFESIRQRSSITDPRERSKVYQGKKCIRSDDYKYILYQDGNEEFFNLLTDPDEKNNIAGESCGEVLSFRKKLDKISERCPPNRENYLEKATREVIENRFKDLGYIE